MGQYDFGHVINRLESDSAKWKLFDSDLLPMWVADMDFAAPPPVIEMLRERVAHGIFGYGMEPPELRQVIVERLARLYNWQVSPDALVFMPGVATGFNMACHAFGEPGDGALVQVPLYGPLLRAPGNAGLCCQTMSLNHDPDGTYSLDMDAFEAAIEPNSKVFLLCNPHNPLGRIYTSEELTAMAEVCLRHDLVICSDEIHADFIYNGHQHTPIASLSPEIESRTITLMAPSKTYNIAGLKFSLAIVPDEALREKFIEAKQGLVPSINVLGYTAALAAYRDSQEWLDQLLAYLEANRDYCHHFVQEELPGVKMALPDATYLAWLDCRDLGLDQEPSDYFKGKAQVALMDGTFFGPKGSGFARLNFGCPRSLLVEGLERMRDALETQG